jgi:hypothetical protein
VDDLNANAAINEGRSLLADVEHLMPVCFKDQGGFVVQAGQRAIEAANMVVATGSYQLPSIPPCSASFPCAIYQVTANRDT